MDTERIDPSWLYARRAVAIDALWSAVERGEKRQRQVLVEPSDLRLVLDELADVDGDAIRRALDECLTCSDIDELMGWAAGTAAKTRQRPAPVGLPGPDAHVGRTPVWFRVSVEAWRAARPGRGAGGGRPRGCRPVSGRAARDGAPAAHGG